MPRACTLLARARFIAGKSIEEVLAAEGTLPDFTWSDPENVGPEISYPLPVGDSDEDLVFIHRHDGSARFTLPPRTKHHSFDVKASFA
jgi:hypothetical protein